MHEKFLTRAAKAAREEAVLDAYQQLLRKPEWPRPLGCDGLVDDTLFEFKMDLSLKKQWAKCLAQACYYLRRILHVGVVPGSVGKPDKTGKTKKIPPQRLRPPAKIAVCGKRESFVVLASVVEDFVNNDELCDWDRAPSTPDPALVKALKREASPGKIFRMDHEEGVCGFLERLRSPADKLVLQHINKKNFVIIFQIWKEKFAPGLSPQEAVRAYLLDLLACGQYRKGKLRLSGDPDDTGRAITVDLVVAEEDWLEFWSTYKRPPTTEAFEEIVSRKDQCIVLDTRRTTGEFFTPLDVCSLAHEYLVKAGVDYNDVTWWDCCSGTGNLVADCPSMRDRLFITTLEREDVDSMQMAGLHPEAYFKRLDFLNDDFPPKIQKALADPERKWVSLVNPPFSGGASGAIGHTVKGVSKTTTQSGMKT
jgi:hypothetical protein